jgi:FMN phosphatase YigB (HAD superfamily)
VTISFDLDDTLIPGTKSFYTERQNLLQKIWGIEKIRLGTIRLMKALQGQGHRVFIYTTSFRSTRKIWWAFFSYGVRIDKVINQKVHDRTLKEKAKDYSKYPPAFNIDFHVDDSKGVKIEGDRYNFKTIIVTETDPGWTDYIQQIVSYYIAG